MIDLKQCMATTRSGSPCNFPAGLCKVAGQQVCLCSRHYSAALQADTLIADLRIAVEAVDDQLEAGRVKASTAANLVHLAKKAAAAVEASGWMAIPEDVNNKPSKDGEG